MDDIILVLVLGRWIVDSRGGGDGGGGKVMDVLNCALDGGGVALELDSCVRQKWLVDGVAVIHMRPQVRPPPYRRCLG